MMNDAQCSADHDSITAAREIQFLADFDPEMLHVSRSCCCNVQVMQLSAFVYITVLFREQIFVYTVSLKNVLPTYGLL